MWGGGAKQRGIDQTRRGIPRQPRNCDPAAVCFSFTPTLSNTISVGALLAKQYGKSKWVNKPLTVRNICIYTYIYMYRSCPSCPGSSPAAIGGNHSSNATCLTSNATCVYMYIYIYIYIYTQLLSQQGRSQRLEQSACQLLRVLYDY